MKLTPPQMRVLRKMANDLQGFIDWVGPDSSDYATGYFPPRYPGFEPIGRTDAGIARKLERRGLVQPSGDGYCVTADGWEMVFGPEQDEQEVTA